MLPVTPMPALLTQTSRLPKVSTAASASARMSSARVTSAVTNVARPLRSRISASVSALPCSSRASEWTCCRRSEHTTAAPSAASARAIERPFPVLEPVTTAVRPWRRFPLMILSLLVYGRSAGERGVALGRIGNEAGLDLTGEVVREHLDGAGLEPFERGGDDLGGADHLQAGAHLRSHVRVDGTHVEGGHLGALAGKLEAQ